MKCYEKKEENVKKKGKMKKEEKKKQSKNFSQKKKKHMLFCKKKVLHYNRKFFFFLRKISVCFLHKGKRVKAAMLFILHHMTRPGPILRGVQIYLRQVFWHALESGLFPLSQHPINTYRVRAVPLVLDPQLLPR